MRSGLIEDEVSTESGSDRVIVLAISIIAISFYPVATALGTDSMTSAGLLPQIRPLPFVWHSINTSRRQVTPAGDGSCDFQICGKTIRRNRKARQLVCDEQIPRSNFFACNRINDLQASCAKEDVRSSKKSELKSRK